MSALPARSEEASPHAHRVLAVDDTPANLSLLLDALTEADRPLEIRRELPIVIATIGTNTAQRILTDNLLQQDVQLRFRVIAALNRLQQLHPEIDLDRQAVETVLMAEILGH